MYDKGDGSARPRARKSDLPSVSVPVFDICIQMRVIGHGQRGTARSGAEQSGAERKCECKSVYARYADRTGRVTRAYTATSRPETRFARLIKQVIIVSAHPIFVRPYGWA